MSGLFDDDVADLPPRPSRRTKVIISAAVIVVLLFFGITTFAALYTQRLWFDALGYGSVFTRLFWTKTLLFLVAALVMALALGAAMVLAFRARPFYHVSEEPSSITRYREAIHPIRGWLMGGICAVAGTFAGVSGTGHWRTFLLWRHSVSFGQTDPYFGKDIGFYVFTLPWWHYVVDFLLVTLVLALIASAVVHYLYGGIRLASSTERVSAPAQVQLSVLGGLLLLVKAIGYWLSRYDLVHHDSALFTGLGYTDHHAVLPGKNILAGVTLICAVLFLANAWRRSWVTPAVGVGLLVVSALLLGLIWPALVQGFQVRTQPQKEAGYLQTNIDATRAAYGIDDTQVKSEHYVPTPTSKVTAKQLDQQLSAASVVDPGLAQSEFAQTQQSGSFYTFNDPLDTDHYSLAGSDRGLVLGVRELNQAGAGDQTWASLHAVYTHGNGIVAAYANQRDSSNMTEERTTQYAEGTSAGQTHRDLEKSLGSFQNQIYFGEDSPSYSVVGREPGTPAVEVDTDPDGTQTTTTYAGAGGVPIGSTFRRLMYAVRFGSANFMLSSAVNDNSRVLYDRSPLQRVAQVAPWLTLDSNVYPVIHQGRILWVVDGYTTTDDYPGSQRASFSAMVGGATQGSGAPTLSTDPINYMRDAVKATVDAYDGTVTLYAWDTTDPILQAWEAAFPNTVHAKDSIPPDLLGHLRYPDDLFKVQRYQLARYHVTDAGAFLDGSQRWQVPEDPNNTGHLEAPYRSLLQAPGANPLDPSGGSAGSSTTPTWSLTSTLVPYERQNLAAIMTVDSNAASPGYGVIRLLTGFDQQTPGPQMVNQAFQSNAAISAVLAKPSHGGATPTAGALMAVPTAHSGLVWIEPVYAYQSTGASTGYATLAQILTSYDGKVGYGRTLEESLASAISGSATKPPAGGPALTPEQRTDAAAARLLAQAESLFTRAEQAAKAGDHARAATYDRQARAKIAQARQLLASAATASPSTSPSSGASSGGASSSPSAAPSSSSSAPPSAGNASTRRPSASPTT